jgi:hypothetical protein
MRALCATFWMIALVAVNLLVPALAAQEPQKAPTAEQIRQWIADLDHDRFSQRQVASRNLAAAGKEAVAALTAAVDGDSLEVTDRAMRILKGLFLSPDASTAAAAKAALMHLSTSPSAAVAQKAQAALRARQERILAKLEAAGASVEINDDQVVSLDLDEVKQLRAVLPLLRDLPELESASLSNPQMGDEELALLKGLPKLRYLNLYRSQIGDEGLKVLKDLPSLRSVPMGETRVTDAGLVHLKDLTHLEYVGLRGNRVTDAGLVHLQNLINLTGLYLGETKVTDGGLVHLKRMTKMTYLRLHTVAVTDEGLEHLRGMTELTQLDLWDTKVTEKGVARLQKVIPGAQITTSRSREPR